MRSRRRSVSVAAVAFVVASGLTACSSETSGSTGTVTIDVTVTNGEVTPTNDRIEVSRNQPVDVVVTADEPGVLGVHASPEFTRDFDGGGATTTIKLQFDRPGQVDLETHDPDHLIATLVIS